LRKSNKKKKKRSPGRLYKYLLVLLIVSAVLFVAAFAFYIVNDIPSVMVLKDLKNKPVSSVYDAKDELTYLFVPDNRVFVPYKKIPGHVKAAFLAAEDADFFKHGGVDPMGILRAFVKNVVYGRLAQGGSTITQQVIKSLVLGPEKSFNRKIREAILAYKLENYLSVPGILWKARLEHNARRGDLTGGHSAGAVPVHTEETSRKRPDEAGVCYQSDGGKEAHLRKG
jgi:penicillin-binding protein 1A